MNAKEKILEMLKNDLEVLNWAYPHLDHSDVEQLITATEKALFDLPSEEEMAKEGVSAITGSGDYTDCFKDGCNYILNYKPETK